MTKCMYRDNCENDAEYIYFGRNGDREVPVCIDHIDEALENNFCIDSVRYIYFGARGNEHIIVDVDDIDNMLENNFCLIDDGRQKSSSEMDKI